MVAPLHKARVRGLSRRIPGGVTVLTLALTATFITMRMASKERSAPVMNPKAIYQRGHMATSNTAASRAMNYFLLPRFKL